MDKILKIVTRTSKLALWQAEWVKSKLQAHHPALKIEIIGIKTEGDKLIDIPLTKVGGKGLFVKALEDYLLTEQADIAVHSLKDLPADLPNDLALAAILKREDPSDAFVSLNFQSLYALPPQARVGTSSLRRQCQLNALRSDLALDFLRGNVDTRLLKLEAGQYDAIILATAGLLRLQLGHTIQARLTLIEMLPAIGQGALGIECRQNDEQTKRLVEPLHHIPTAHCILAERSMGAALGGGCLLPIAGYANLDHTGLITLRGMVGTPDGSRVIKATAIDKPEAGVTLGQTVANELLKKGAQEILTACR